MDDKVLSAVAHYVMMHYAEKELIKKCKRNYKPKAWQFGLDAGLKKFGSRGGHLHRSYTNSTSMKCSNPCKNRDVKAQFCVDQRVQQDHVAKEEAASSTIGLELVFATAAIDAKENQEVVTIDIPGAILHATNKDYVVMRMNGMLFKLMAKMNPKLYRKDLTDEKRKECTILTP